MKEGIRLNKNYKYYVDGIWKESHTNDVIEIYSPYKEELVGTVQALSKEEARCV